MGLASITRVAARVGFLAAGDAKVACTVRTGPTPVHDTETDLSTTTWAHTSMVFGILYDATEREGRDAKTPKARFKALLLKSADLPVPPTEESVVLIAGDKWEVASVETDPTAATHTLTLRR